MLKVGKSSDFNKRQKNHKSTAGVLQKPIILMRGENYNQIEKDFHKNFENYRAPNTHEHYLLPDSTKDLILREMHDYLQNKGMKDNNDF